MAPPRSRSPFRSPSPPPSPRLPHRGLTEKAPPPPVPFRDSVRRPRAPSGEATVPPEEGVGEKWRGEGSGVCHICVISWGDVFSDWNGVGYFNTTSTTLGPVRQTSTPCFPTPSSIQKRSARSGTFATLKKWPTSRSAPLWERHGASAFGATPQLLQPLQELSSERRPAEQALIVYLHATSNISIVKEAQTMLDPDLFNIIRFTIAAIPFVPFLLKSLRDMQVVLRGVELGVWVTLAYLTQSIGLVTADAGRASFISALTVIIVPFLDGILGAEIPAYTWLGAFLSVLGVGILELSGSPPCVGDLLTLLSAFCFGIHMLRTEHISRKMKKENFLPLVGCQVVVVAVVSAVSFIVKCFLQNVVPWNLKSGTPTELFSMMSSFPWLAILYTGIIATTFCLWAEIVAMRDVSATETAIIYGLEPVWGATFAWAIHGERWGITGLIGAIFIIVDHYCEVIRQVVSMTLQQDLTTIMASCTRNGKLTRLTKIGVAWLTGGLSN
ncbi:unnamed protein product [Triticum turgidum subsp. durum]|uniref:EamA domain-containing protein n=1 Tax=Triticum turgidum subsp. durum TaxID=4567 RepID=A0A9R1BLV6_TRITD|nr:unnamed protein product [Triticum turgidum subsp. durum]